MHWVNHVLLSVPNTNYSDIYYDCSETNIHKINIHKHALTAHTHSWCCLTFARSGVTPLAVWPHLCGPQWPPHLHPLQQRAHEEEWPLADWCVRDCRNGREWCAKTRLKQWSESSYECACARARAHTHTHTHTQTYICIHTHTLTMSTARRLTMSTSWIHTHCTCAIRVQSYIP